ncbi:Probable RNA-directed DNA polymerase from transposon BS [Eumeta japonica]|uniref:Probable RNA-directed DNA polymerase from transposon BS n=1 Tax=Eumeta variegata TaxID=151549 RepID=A0A4C1UJQ0_EUMVA|nr:Probable RNA-directed DNA polymerase from transposon BS [Eumeta japonica]
MVENFKSGSRSSNISNNTLIPPLKRPDGSIALDDAEVAECIADSIETQCSHASPPHDTAHISRIEEEVLQKTSLEPRDDLTPVSLSEVQTLVKSLKTRKAPGLDGISNKAIKCFPQQLLSLLVAIFNACLQNCYFPLSGRRRRHERTHSTRRLIRAGVPQGFALSPLLYSAHTNDIPRPTSGVQLTLFADDTALFYRNRYRDVAASRLQRAIDELGQWFRLWRIEVNPEKSAAIQFKYSKRRSVTLDRNLNFRDHIARVRKTALFYTARLGALLGRKSKLSRLNKRTIYKMCIRTVMTYASPVFAHAAPKALEKLQDASKRFFDIAGSHPNALLRAAVDYQPPPPTHFIRSPRNVLFDPPDALTAAVGDFFSGFQPHTTHAYGREGVRDRHFLTPPRRKWETKKKIEIVCRQGHRSRNVASKARLTLCTLRSHAPSMKGALREMKRHCMACVDVSRAVASTAALCSSACVLQRLVPLSHQISLGAPRLAVIRCKASMALSVVREPATFMYGSGR